MWCRVAKDVARTDSEAAFYTESPQNQATLSDILVTYTMYNFDLGYVQGMSDLASVIFQVIGEEVAAFWCFAGLMEEMAQNFSTDQVGMSEHLQNLRSLLRYMDPGW